MRKIKIALAQMECELGNKEVNINKALDYVKQASIEGADIICLPELTVSGYNLDVLKDDLKELSDTLTGDTVKTFKNAASQNKIHIIIPLILNENDVIKNSAVLIDDEGNVMGQYNKNHMFGQEGLYFGRDNQYPVFETKFGRIGILICYDINFPEPARVLALSGVEVILVAAAWRIQDADKWDMLTNVRALENTVFVAAVNAYAEYENLTLFGHSKVISPVGKVLAESNKKGAELIIHQIDLDDIKTERQGNPYLKDRLPKGYSKLVEV
ncbi:carbon-nitrogen hydrolase [Bacillota bacterium]